MDAARNKEIVTRFMALFSTRQLDAAFELLDPAVTWSLWGAGPGAGEYDKSDMRDLLMQSWQWFKEPVAWTPTVLTAEDDRVAVLAVSSAVTHGGYRHAGRYHNLFRLRDGKIVEVQEMFLEAPVQRLFEVLREEAATLPPDGRG